MEEIKQRLTTFEDSVLSLISHNERILAMLNGFAANVDDNFIKVGERLSNIENRLNILTNKTSNSFTEVGDKLGGIEADFGDQMKGIKAELIKIGDATRYQQHYEDRNKFNLPD